ncbi:MAG: hypothetical protein KY391_00715 [Actinobacteria bacterium]|nr:hypothetical protein [Actinomycetota bacterium]
MKLYAETRRLRTRQIALDVTVFLWTLVWIWLGMFAHDVIAELAEPAQAIARNSGSLAASLYEISDTLDETPLVGGALEEPFTSAGDSAQALANESREQHANFLRTALWIGLLIAIAPIAAALLRYLPDRWRWVQEATAATQIRLDADDLYLFALRAVANRPLSELRKATPDPGAALASGDYDTLARLELEQIGLRP